MRHPLSWSFQDFGDGLERPVARLMAACKDHDHLYHGTQVNNQVPPL
jgi:hypothetical protein